MHTGQARPIPTIVYLIALCQFAVPFMFSGVGITLPAMGLDLGASALSLSLVETVYLGVSCALLLPAGRFADNTDHGALLKAGLLMYALSTLVIGFVERMDLVILLRVIQGIAAALMMATGMAIIADNVDVSQRGKAIGLAVGSTYAGLAAGPFIAGYITGTLGWRWVYFATCIPVFMAFVLLWRSLPSLWSPPRASQDWPGSLLITSVILALVFGSAFVQQYTWAKVLLGLTLPLLLGFFWWEARCPLPLLSPGTFRNNPPLINALTVQLLMYGGSLGVTFLFSLYLQTLKGLSPEQTGQLLVISPVLMAMIAPFSGRLADRLNPNLIAALGLFFALISLLLAAFIKSDDSLFHCVLILVLQGIGFALFSSPNMAIIMASVQPRETALASALAAKMRSLGMVLGMSIINLLLVAHIGEASIHDQPEQLLPIMQNAFGCFAGLGVLANVLSLRRLLASRSLGAQ